MFKSIFIYIIIFWRYISIPLFKNRLIHNDFLNIQFDPNIKNSFLEIEFYFADLIFLQIPKLGKKIYNGKLLLNASNLEFPLKIKLRTYRGVEEIIIEQNEAPIIIKKEKFLIDSLENIQSNSISINFDQLNLQNLKIAKAKTTKERILIKNVEVKDILKNIQISKSIFNKTDYL